MNTQQQQMKKQLKLNQNHFQFQKISQTYFCNQRKKHVASIALSEINHIAAISDNSGVIYLVSLQICKRLRKVPKKSHFAVMKFSQDGKLLVVGQADDPYEIILFNMEQGIQNSCQGHKYIITRISFLNNAYILSISEDKTMRIWNMQTRELVTTSKYGECVYGLAVNGELKMIGLTCRNGYAYLYNYNLQKLKDLKLKVCWKASDGACKDLVFLEKVNKVITCGQQEIKIWEISRFKNQESQELPIRILFIKDQIWHLQLVLDQQILVGIGGQATFLNIFSGSVCAEFQINKYLITEYYYLKTFKKIAIHSDLRYAIGGPRNGQILLFKIKDGINQNQNSLNLI